MELFVVTLADIVECFDTFENALESIKLTYCRYEPNIVVEQCGDRRWIVTVRHTNENFVWQITRKLLYTAPEHL